MTAMRLATALLALVAAELVVILVTHDSSLWLPGRGVTAGGFALRAGLLGVLLVLRLRVLPAAPDRIERGRLLLALLLLPTLVQFQVGGGRLNGDGLMYYPYVRSIWKDFDLDLANEYAQFGLLERGDLAIPTSTGLRRSIFSIGPAVVWTPFFLLGEGIGRARALWDPDVDLSGYGPVHVNAVCLGSLLYGFLALLLIHSLLRRHFGGATALGAALLVWGATFLHWYMVEQPAYAHAASTCAAALALWLWDRERGRRGAWGFLRLGLVLGLAMCIRWQNGLLLLLPGFELAASLRAAPRALSSHLRLAAALAAGTTLGVVPQLAAWKAIYGSWLLRDPPHGADFLRLDHPFVLETFFSSRHGLLSWTPALWAGYLGFLPLLRRKPMLAWPLLPLLAAMTYVNLCSGDWWAGGSFSNRRFDSVLPLLALGFAASIDWARERLGRRPELALALLAGPLVAWNVLLAEQLRRGFLPRDETVAFPRLVTNAAQLLADGVGSPPTWPASWIFAWRHGLSPGRYDLVVGRYLFYRQNNMGGHIGLAGARDRALLAEGWGPVETVEGREARRVQGRARLLAPLDVAEDLEIQVSATAAAPGCEVRLFVNGSEAARFFAREGWTRHHVQAGARFWRRERNELVFDAGAARPAFDSVDFARRGAR
jgi:hypothetical protein